jgi:uncharacterized OsmC-like protein
MAETKHVHGTLNGVDVDRLVATIETLDQSPALGTFRFRARNRWLNGGHNRSRVDTFFGAGQEHADRKKTFKIDNDEPEILLGQDTSANPAEYVLHALAGCLTTNLVYQAAAQGIPLHEVECRLSGELDLRGMLGLADVRCGYEDVQVAFTVRADAPREKLEELLELAKSRSPVADMLNNQVPLLVTLED